MEYGIEELAAAADERVDTIRYYQAKGLLPRPARRGRTAVYDESHLELLRRIRGYQDQGFTLALIKRVLDERDDSRSAALLAAVSEERGARALTLTELAAESGVPEAILASLRSAGLLVPTRGSDAEELYADADAQMARAGLRLLGQGFPLDALLHLAVQHARGIEEVCDRAIDLFDQHVRKVGSDGAEPAEVAATFQELLPAVTTLVAVHFQRTLLHRALQRLRATEERDPLAAAVAAVAAADSGRLEVRWT